MNSVDFIPGLKLSEYFFLEDVKPILDKYFQDLKYSTGLIGSGSEVLGFDDEVSRDHDWGPRLILFINDDDYLNLNSSIDEILKNNLLPTCHGYSTNFCEPDAEGSRLLKPSYENGINHAIELTSIKHYFNNLLGVDIYEDLSFKDWLSFPQQILLSIQSGEIFSDQIGLNDIRSKLNYYPDDIWLFLMASSWQRIGQEEHLAARGGFTNQDIGFSVIASRLVRDIMQLGFLLEKKFAPYAKWLEKAFCQLNCAEELIPLLSKIIHSSDWKIRQENLCLAFEVLAKMHNNLDITEPINSKCSEWHKRSFKAIHGERFAKIITKSIEDSKMQTIIQKGLVGGIDQISDNTDVLENLPLRRALVDAVFKKLS